VVLELLGKVTQVVGVQALAHTPTLLLVVVAELARWVTLPLTTGLQMLHFLVVRAVNLLLLARLLGTQLVELVLVFTAEPERMALAEAPRRIWTAL
jgi:hypothetical protein